jgi:hypothetical protein
MDVGFDGHPEFRPYNLLREIVPIMNKREMLSDMPNDHHLERLLNVTALCEKMQYPHF